MNSLKSTSIRDILKSYEFSHKFYVQYAYSCALIAQEFAKKPKPESIKCLELVKQWLNGKEVSKENLKAAAYAAAYAAAAAANAAYDAYAAYAAAAYAAADAAAADAADADYAAVYAADAAVYAANAAVYAAYAAADAAAARDKTYNKCKELLINMINDLSKVEKLLLNIEMQ